MPENENSLPVRSTGTAASLLYLLLVFTHETYECPAHARPLSLRHSLGSPSSSIDDFPDFCVRSKQPKTAFHFEDVGRGISGPTSRTTLSTSYRVSRKFKRINTLAPIPNHYTKPKKYNFNRSRLFPVSPFRIFLFSAERHSARFCARQVFGCRVDVVAIEMKIL